MKDQERKSKWSIIWKVIAVIVIIRGVVEIIKKYFEEKAAKREEKTKFSEQPEHYALFNGRKLDGGEGDYKGGVYTVLMGGIELDLSDAVIKEDVSVTCKAVMGGIDVKVPNDVNVLLSGTVLFGGVANMVPEGRTGATVYLHTEGVMGGVCVRAAGAVEEKDDPSYGGVDIQEEDFVEEEQYGAGASEI